MSTPASLSTQADVIAAIRDEQSLVSLFRHTAAASADRPALRLAGSDTALTWAEVRRSVEGIAGGLAAHGVRRGDSVALLLRNVPGFHLLDLATLTLGATPVSLYPTDPVDRMSAVLAASGARVLVSEPAFSAIADELAARVDLDVHVDIGEVPRDGTVGLADLSALPSPIDVVECGSALTPDDAACLLYTSGTTGSPKGVEVSHRAVLASMANYAERAPLTPNGRVLSYLPTAHIADRFAAHYAGIAYGHEIVCVPDPAVLLDVVRDVEPTHFFVVPRVLEKVAAAAMGAVTDSHLRTALDARLADLRRDGFTVWRRLEDRDPRFEAARRAVGLGRAEWLTVGSAPSSRGIVEQMAALDLPFADIWGMTEIIVCTMNPPESLKFGTIGQPFPDVELTLGPDGELLASGPSRFTAYRNDPERSAAALDPDGRVLTGDLAEIDAEGYVRIVGRKKDIMINAAGKNLSPLEIEGALKSASPLIDHAAAVADGRRFVTAVISLDPGQLEQLAREHDLSGNYAELTRHPVILDEVARAVTRANSRLARVEQVRGWTVVPDEWRPGDGLVTSSLKLVRAAVVRRYTEEIETLYAD